MSSSAGPEAAAARATNMAHPKKLLSLLDLPYSVRRKIYLLCGASGETINIVPANAKAMLRRHTYFPLGITTVECGEVKTSNESRKRTSVVLLRVCRKIHSEIHQILFGGCVFVLVAHSWREMGRLRQLSPATLGAMRCLVMVMRCWRAGMELSDARLARYTEEDSNYYFGERSSWAHNLSFTRFAETSTPSPEEVDHLAVWADICQHLADSISPSQLRLTLACDVWDVQSAQEVVSPLLLLPKLGECTIRLCRGRNAEIEIFARRIANRLTSRNSQLSPFPFKSLPRELRLMILGFTHLGREGDYHPRYRTLRIENGRLVKNDNPNFRSGACCGTCCEIPALRCSCPDFHASFSPSCTCRRIPFSLFLVSRMMYEEAREVFYPKLSLEFYQDHLASYRFLKRLPARGLNLLRSLKFCFKLPHFRHWTTRGYRDQWQHLVGLLLTSCNLPLLSLVVDMEDLKYILMGNQEDSTENREVYNVMIDVTNTLCRLEGLGDVTFNLGWYLGLGPWMERTVLGKEREGKTRGPRRLPYDPRTGPSVPSWHCEDGRVVDTEEPCSGF